MPVLQGDFTVNDELIGFFKRILATQDWHIAHGGSSTSGVNAYVSNKVLKEIRECLAEHNPEICAITDCNECLIADLGSPADGEVKP